VKGDWLPQTFAIAVTEGRRIPRFGLHGCRRRWSTGAMAFGKARRFGVIGAPVPGDLGAAGDLGVFSRDQ
jgi:hypothetical protein